MITNYTIKPFFHYVVRLPLLPLSAYLNLVDNYSSEKAVVLYNQPVISEAINLASPELRDQLDKWKIAPSSLTAEKRKAIEFTLVKYLARMSSRCTPFGLFAGCSIGRLSSQTNITVESIDNHERFTQFDMQFWIAMMQNIAQRKEIAIHLKYFPNTSIYEIGDFYRYIEYKYIETKREHTITSLRKSSHLKKILLHTKSGNTIDEMVSLLIDDDSEKEEARAFVLQLIDFHFIVTDLDGVVTGSNEWKRVLSIINNISDLKNESNLLKKLKIQLGDLDTILVPPKELYQKIKRTIDHMGTSYDKKYLFQTDLNITTFKNNLDVNVSQKVIKAIRFLNGIKPQNEGDNLENFKKAFLQRYESKEMSLNVVLDTEIGIGYLYAHDMNDTHEILNNFSFKVKNKQEENQVWTTNDFMLQNKLQNCLLTNDKSISISEKDFPDFKDDLVNVPATFSVIIELLNNEIALTSSGNTSASQLLARFCNSNEAINSLTKEIIQKENDYHPDKILAEIVHISESRTGNIVRRPMLREFEISYLCIPGVSKENNIDLNDLWISIQSNKIILFSKKHNKEVIPCLSNAHNFNNNSLPIYHFLCDLGIQNKNPIYSFNWGVLASHYNFFPRVIYNGIILSKARWIIKGDEILNLSKIDRKDISNGFLNWRLNRNIPRFANLVNSDNTLLFDFESSICIELLLKYVKAQKEVILEEFLFTEKLVAENKSGEGFCNQFILSFYKERV